MTPTTTTHARLSSNRAPVSELATRSPISTKPPMAVRTPRKIDSTFFTVFRSLVVVREGAQLHPIGLERLGDSREVVEPAPPDGEAHVGHMINGGLEDVVELHAQGVGARVRWLYRRERAL